MSTRVPPNRPSDPRYEEARAQGGPLSAQLASYDAALRRHLPEAGAAYEHLVERLKQAGAGGDAPSEGDVLPPFQLPDQEGRLVSSEALLANGPLIVSFNRGNWCPYCWLELSALQESYPAIVAAGGSVVSITPEVATFSRRLRDRLGLSFPVFTDLDNGYALSLGLAFALTEEVRAVYQAADIDLGAFQRSEGWFLPIPATLLVDRHGVVRQAYVNADFRERIEPSTLPDLLAEL
jgi:peroxiredoxin